MEEQITRDASPPRASDSKTELQRQYVVFAVLWAIASMLIAWQRRELAASSPVSAAIQFGIGITAFAVLIRPTWTIPLFLVGVLHVAHGLFEMPALTTTAMIWLFFGATICVSFVSNWIVNRSYQVGPVSLYRSAAPCLRVMLVLSLIAIGVARLNWTFLDLETSPVTSTLSLFRGDGMTPHWVSYLTMSMLVVVHLFVAAALLVPSLRRFAVGFGSCYFSWQAMIGFGETRMMLPAIILGLYLFTSTELIGRLRVTVERWVPFRAVRASGLAVITAVVAILASGLWYQDRVSLGAQVVTSQQLVSWFYVGFVLLWCSVLLSGLIDGRPRLVWVPLMTRNPAHYVLLTMLLLFAVSPYFGIGSRGRFVEFSGLSTGSGPNNHLLIPQSHLLLYERDLVEVTNAERP